MSIAENREPALMGALLALLGQPGGIGAALHRRPYSGISQEVAVMHNRRIVEQGDIDKRDEWLLVEAWDQS